MTETSFWRSCSTTERDRRNGRRANLWLFIWMLTFVGAIFAFKREWLLAGPAAYAAIAISGLVGVVALAMYLKFIREVDELQRRIILEALALGFGGAFLATMVLSLAERVGYQADLGDPFLVMIALYVVGYFLGMRRYA